MALTTAAAWIPSLRGGFVYDDHRFLADNEHLTSASILWRAFADPASQTADGTEAGLWRPLRTLSFALDRALSDAALGAHAVNVLIHALCAGLLFVLLRRFGATAMAAFCGTLLFALHPAQVECVAWISSRGDLLAFALLAGAILLDLSGRPWLALIAGCAALLAKEQAIVWPALAWISARLAGRTGRSALRAAIGPAVVTAAFLAVRHAILVQPLQEGGLGHGTLGAAQLCAMLGHQVWYALVPVGTLFDWQMPIGACPWPVAVAALASIVAAAWPPTRLAAFWFLAALVPTLFIQVVVPLNIFVADRWLCFALPALAIAAARAVDRFGPAPALVAALGLGAMTQMEIPAWRSDATLWARTAERVPGHLRANHWLGVEAIRRRDFAQAAGYLRVVETGPGRHHLATALDALGRAEESPKLLEEAYNAYQDSARLFAGDPRAEGRARMLPIGRVAAANIALMLTPPEFGVRAMESLLASPPPEIPEAAREVWTLRIGMLAADAENHPLLGAGWGDRVRAWGRLP